MKKTVVLLVLWTLLAAALPCSTQSAQVTRVSPEKWNKLTPKQKKRFIEMGKEAQSAAEGSIDDYNEVGDSTDPNRLKDKLHDTIEDSFGPKVRCLNCADGIRQ